MKNSNRILAALCLMWLCYPLHGAGLSGFAGTYECLLFDGDYSDSLAVAGTLRNISKSPDGIVVRGKLVVTVTKTGAFTAAADYIESRAPEVIPNSVLTESGTIQIPKTEDCTAGIKKLRDLRMKRLTFSGVLSGTAAGKGVLDRSKKLKVTGGNYGLDLSFALESVSSSLTTANSTQPRVMAALTDRECLGDLQRPSYVSKGSSFVLVSKFLPQANPTGRYITTMPEVSDPDFPKDLSEGSTNLLKFDVSASGLVTYSIEVPDPSASISFALIPGRLSVDGTVVFQFFLTGKAPGSDLRNPRNKSQYIWTFAAFSTVKLVNHPQRQFELLLGPDSFSESSYLLKVGAKHVMSDETNLEWRIEHYVGFTDDYSTGKPVAKSAVQTDQAEGQNDYTFNQNVRAIMLKNHSLSKSAGKYSLIIGNPEAPFAKYDVTLSAQGKLLDAVVVSEGSWTVQGPKASALKLSFDATKGQLTGSLPVQGSFYRSEREIEAEDAEPVKMKKTISLFGGVYDEPANLFNPSLRGKVVAIGNANPYSLWYTIFGPAWILVDETQ
jgi:hypothetical protein